VTTPDAKEIKMSITPTSSARRNRDRAVAAVAAATGLALITSAMLLSTAGAVTAKTITVTQNKTWGPTLTMNGDTLYRLTKDSTNKSACTGKCATVWLPVELAAGQKAPVGMGVSHLGSFTRSPGVRQVTYEGIPLYTFIGDKKAGQVTGNIKDTWGQWWSINPSSPLTPPKKKGTTTTTTTTPGGISY
jgi:predicted lipoprotein with Yx(FWY)xxD motif